MQQSITDHRGALYPLPNIDVEEHTISSTHNSAPSVAQRMDRTVIEHSSEAPGPALVTTLAKQLQRPMTSEDERLFLFGRRLGIK